MRATAQASFAAPRRGGKTIAHGVSRGFEMTQEHPSPGGAKEPVAPFGGWELGRRCALPRLTPWATLFGPCRGRARKPCRTPCRRFPHFGLDRVSRNVLILSRAASEEGGRWARWASREPYAGRPHSEPGSKGAGMSGDDPGSRRQLQGGTQINWQDAKVDHYVVCLIDVLGTGRDFSRWPMVDPDKPETYGPIINSVFPVIHFHLMFSDFFTACQQGRTPEILRQSLPETEIDRFLQCTDYTLGTQWFSDTFVFYARTYNARGELSTVPVIYFLMACCLAMLDSLANANPVRGALCVGQGIELGEHNFFGPAFAQAHYLESRCAGYPRVVVSPETLQFAQELALQDATDEMAERMRRLACQCSTLFIKDADGQFIVDYLGSAIRHFVTGQDLEKLSAVVKSAYDFAVDEQRPFTNEKDPELARRYRLLRQYIESQLPIWGIQANA